MKVLITIIIINKINEVNNSDPSLFILNNLKLIALADLIQKIPQFLVVNFVGNAIFSEQILIHVFLLQVKIFELLSVGATLFGGFRPN